MLRAAFSTCATSPSPIAEAGVRRRRQWCPSTCASARSSAWSGKSGSGKSTVIRSLIQLLPANATIGGGTVTFAGRGSSEFPAEDAAGPRPGYRHGVPGPAKLPEPGHDCGSANRRNPEKCRGSRPVPAWKILAAMRLVHIPDPERLYGAYLAELSGRCRAGCDRHRPGSVWPGSSCQQYRCCACARLRVRIAIERIFRARWARTGRSCSPGSRCFS